MEETPINQNVQSENEGLSLKDIFYIIKKHLLAICLFVVVATGAGFGLGKVKNKISPQYTSHATMMVSVDEGVSLTQGYTYSKYISETVAVLLKEDAVIDPVAQELGMRSSTIKKNLSANLIQDTLIIRVSYTCTNPNEAITIINKVCDSAVTIANLPDPVDPSKDKYPLLHGNIAPVTYADNSKVTLASVTKKYTLIAFAAGVVLAAAYVVIREMFDNSFKSNAEIERELGMPVLANIPSYEIKDLEEIHKEKEMGGKK